MATLAQIREGLKTRLATISDVQVSAYMLSNPTPPTLQVMGPDEIEFDGAMGRGHDDVMMVVQGFVGAVADQGAQVNLDRWLAPSGASSVKAAIEADRTLGGIVDTLRVTRCSGYRVYQSAGGGQMLGADWSVYVLNPGT